MRRGALIGIIIAALALLLLPLSARAGCSNPADSENKLIYNSACHTFQFCNGTSWITAGQLSSPTSFNAQFGETTVLGSTDTAEQNKLVSQSVTLAQPGTIQSLSIDVTTAAGKVRLGIYDATGPSGGPGNLLASTASTTVTTGWNTINVTTPVALAAGNYWLAFNSNNNSLVVASTAASGNTDYYAFTYGALPATYSAAPSTRTGHDSFYATLITSACINPSGSEGQMIYNSDYHTLQYCNGNTWYPLGTGSGGSSGNCSSPTGTPGQFIYNQDYHTYQYCNGTNWVKFGGGSSVSLTSDAVFWTAQTAAEPNTWTSVTYGNGLFVAVASSGTHRVMTSPDGITWTAQTAAAANAWTSVTFGNNLFVAVSQNGVKQAMTSPDGITWTAQTAAETNNWMSVAFGNGLFVAVANNGTHRVMTSPDGSTWAAQTAASAKLWQGITYGNGLYVAFAPSADEMTSSDGVTWTGQTPPSATYYAVAFGNGVFAAIAPEFVSISSDAITWTQYGGSGVLLGGNWTSGTYGNGLFVITSNNTGDTSQLATSTDGVTWTAPTIPEKNAWNSAVYGNGTFVAVASSGFGQADGYIAGKKVRFHYLCMDLPHSDGCFVKAYPAETAEALCDGHVGAFAFFGGVPQSILYDNTRLAVTRIVKGGRRLRSQMFAELQSCYLFEDKFGRPGKGNDKGKVEGLVGFSRRNFMTPLPVADSFEALNARLLDACTKRRRAILRGHTETIDQRMQADAAAFMPLPPAPYDACHKAATRVSSMSLVRYKNNDYSVPTRYGHQEVLAKGYVDRVEIACRGEIIATHVRSYGTAEFVYDPLHYLALLEHKSRALDQAAPLEGWRLGECINRLRRLMEARMGGPGRREFIQVLRLMEDFHQHQVEDAVAQALKLGAVSFDAVKMLLLARLENRPVRLDLTFYPYLPAATVGATDPRAYLGLIANAGSRAAIAGASA